MIICVGLCGWRTLAEDGRWLRMPLVLAADVKKHFLGLEVIVLPLCAITEMTSLSIDSLDKKAQHQELMTSQY